MLAVVEQRDRLRRGAAALDLDRHGGVRHDAVEAREFGEQRQRAVGAGAAAAQLERPRVVAQRGRHGGLERRAGARAQAHVPAAGRRVGGRQRPRGAAVGAVDDRAAGVQQLGGDLRRRHQRDVELRAALDVERHVDAGAVRHR